jgi:GDPmannose 4,6-dehydratase
MKALIFGISGQDGSYLSELLLSKGIEVYGVVRRHSVAENQDYRLKDIEDQLTTIYGDVTDALRCNEIISTIKPDIVFNLAAQSHVRVSFEVPKFTFEVNAIGVLNILEAIKHSRPSAVFYQASSSEMFGRGVDADGMQRESTQMLPVSPYGIAKLSAYHFTNHYRDSFGIKTYNGILFNHESPRRGSNFVTTKIVKGAVEISLGQRDRLQIGNLDASRDWGHSKDYVRAMLLMVTSDSPDNYVVSTGETRTVREFCQHVFQILGLDWEKYVTVDSRFLRPNELPYLKGDSTKIRRELGWNNEVNFSELVFEMVDHWTRVLSK